MFKYLRPVELQLMRGGNLSYIKALQAILQSTRTSVVGRVTGLFLGRLARTGTIMIDVIMVDLVAAKTPFGSFSTSARIGHCSGCHQYCA